MGLCVSSQVALPPEGPSWWGFLSPVPVATGRAVKVDGTMCFCSGSMGEPASPCTLLTLLPRTQLLTHCHPNNPADPVTHSTRRILPHNDPADPAPP